MDTKDQKPRIMQQLKYAQMGYFQLLEHRKILEKELDRMGYPLCKSSEEQREGLLIEEDISDIDKELKSRWGAKPH